MRLCTYDRLGTPFWSCASCIRLLASGIPIWGLSLGLGFQPRLLKSLLENLKHQKESCEGLENGRRVGMLMEGQTLSNEHTKRLHASAVHILSWQTVRGRCLNRIVCIRLSDIRFTVHCGVNYFWLIPLQIWGSCPTFSNFTPTFRVLWVWTLDRRIITRNFCSYRTLEDWLDGLYSF